MAVDNSSPWTRTAELNYVYATVSCSCDSNIVTVNITSCNSSWRIRGRGSEGDNNEYLSGSTDGTFTFESPVPTTKKKGYALQVLWGGNWVNSGQTAQVEGNSFFTVDFNHSYTVSSSSDATCTSPGYKTYSCSGCWESYTEDIPALGHSSATATVAPTCTDQGYTKRYCTRCNTILEKTNYTAALGHNYSSSIEVQPTCTDQGYTQYTCSKCGGTKKENIVNPLGHLWDEGIIEIEPTHTTEGTMKYTCLRDGCGATNLVVIAKKTGSIRISDGITYDTYSIYIYDGSVWHVYAPYIFNGTSWEAYS
jgi:hypothetical protein